MFNIFPKTSNTELKYKVISTRTGGTVATFGIKRDAEGYAKMLEGREGPNGVIYKVI